ncbi:GHMP kinase [candidate division KSB1 bacterium]|nr:GHMP kinase [candidate division KSB1 bacterium]
MIVRSKAPLRISFAGGGTDISPYMDEHGGVVLSATIDKYAFGSLRVRDDREVTVQSLDYDIMAKYNLDGDMKYDGELDLVKAAIKNMNNGYNRGMDFFIHSDAPPGSGLGSSSTMVVALIGLLKHLQRLPLTNYELAELAYKIERKDLDIKGGMQDQYAAVFGGFNFIEFGASAVIVNPLRIDTEIINELEYCLLLCYTGKTRLSANIISTQIDHYKKKEVNVLKAMESLKNITVEMKNTLLQGKLTDFGNLLHEAWMNKKQMARQITTSNIDLMYQTAREHGALGGKILGAGGGGYLLLFCEFDKKHIVAEQLEKLGGQIVEFTFDRYGLQTWEVQS